MSGHTPGPWEAKIDGTTEGELTIIANVDGEYFTESPSPRVTFDVIAVCEDEYGERLPNALANARLIAAAPDLLEALKQLHLKAVIGTDAERHDALNAAWAAIAKATGQ